VVERRTTSGLGDLVVRGEVPLLSGTATRPWITALARLKLPTADEDRGLGTGKTDLEGGFGLVHPMGGVNLLLDVTYARIGRPEWIELQDVVRLGGGVSIPLGPRPGTNAYAYFENRTSPVPGLEDQRSLAVGGNARFGAGRRLRLTGSLLSVSATRSRTSASSSASAGPSEGPRIPAGRLSPAAGLLKADAEAETKLPFPWGAGNVAE
jgi:hypothetical protein